MSNIITVMKKEFARFFGDKRVVAMVLLPGIMIYVVYSFMGVAMANMFAPDEHHIGNAYGVNVPMSIKEVITNMGEWLAITEISITDAEAAKEEISLRKPMSVQNIRGQEPIGVPPDILMIFPPDFDEQVAAFRERPESQPAPNVEIYFNSTDPNSHNKYWIIISVLDEYKSSMVNVFDVNRGVEDADQATSEDMTANLISSLMPMLLMIFLFSGCIGLAPESIAGEKERGTLATLLVTPLGRSELAAGKILSLAVLSFLAGLVTALATILALPRLFGGAADDMAVAGIYSASDYLMLALVILTSILLIIAAISIISAFAKTVKEANMAVSPLMVVAMLVGVTGMFGSGAQESPVYYLIPLYNSVQSMSGIFSLDYSAANIMIASVSNFIYACVGGFALTKMFNNEKIMFSR